MRQEAEFTRKFLQWARSHLLVSCAIEVKHTRGRAKFRMAELKGHQRDALAAASSFLGLAYKIPDDGRAYKPFDAVLLTGADAWVALCFPGEFFVIDAARLARWEGPSLPRDAAAKMARFTGALSDL